MPYVRKYKKKSVRSRNVRRYKARPTRSLRSFAQKVHKFSRYCNDTCITNTTPNAVFWDAAPQNWSLGVVQPDDNGLNQFGGAMKFQLADVVDTVDFTRLFDRYKLDMVKVTLMPLMNQGYGGFSSTGNVQTTTIPTLMTAIDYDDASVPNSSTVLLERQNCKSYRFDKPVTVTIRNPKILQDVQQGDAIVSSISAMTTSPKYLDCNDIEVNHFGLKFYLRDYLLPDGALKLNSLVRIRCKYFLSFKEPK